MKALLSGLDNFIVIIGLMLLIPLFTLILFIWIAVAIVED